MNRKEKLWLPQFLREIEAMKMALRKEVAEAEKLKQAKVPVEKEGAKA